ncbi:MAG: AAA family ATPase, partial [Chromatiaceae bacterium]
MYDSYYGFSQAPFGLSPDVYFCYPHRSYLRAKAYMQYALHRGEGFVVVTGRPGTGKTTLIQDLLRDLGSRHQLVARIDSTQLDADDLLRLVTYSFGLKSQGFDKATLIQSLREFLLGRTAIEGKAILIVDEAQNLSSGALEELRLITNLQHGANPLAQIFLIGQETLRDLVRHPSLEQLHQRIVAACHLEPLDLLETRAYIRHRLLLAGWSGNPVYTADALRLIFDASGGVPRLINKVCDRLMLHGSLEECSTLTGEDTRLVLREFREEFLERIDDANPDLASSGRSLADLPPIDDLRADAPAPAQTPDAAPASEAPRTQEQVNDTDSERTEAPDPGLGDGVLQQKAPTASPDAFGAPDAQRDWKPPTREASDQTDRRSTQVDNAQRPLPFVPAEPDGAAIQSSALNSGQAAKAHDGTGESPGALKRAPVAVNAARIEGKKRRRWPYGVAAGLLAIAGIAYLLHHYGQGRLSVPDLWERAESLFGRAAVSEPDPEAGGGVALRPSERREEPSQPPPASRQGAATEPGESSPPSRAGRDPRLGEGTAPAVSGASEAAPSALTDKAAPSSAEPD